MLKYLLMFLMAIGITSGAYADTDAVLDDDGEIELTDEQIQQEFQKLQDAMVKRGVKFKPITLSDAEIKQMVQNALDNYEKAKTKEQSIENRVNSSVAIASEGIGGMLLAKGLAEKKADEAAERDMKAYLQTFKCDYGQGPNIRGGTENVELPGANTLLPLYQEYKELAADLKMRKEVLGLKPGIESEVILDKSNMGLYDDVNLGIEDGAYTSISRALRDPDGKDAKEWEEQKKQSQTEAIAGGSVAGAGAIGTTVGNMVINKDKTNTNSKTKNNSLSNTSVDVSALQGMLGAIRK